MWAATRAFKIGPVHVGVRSDPAQADALVREMLAPHLVPGLDGPPNYSVRFEARGGDDDDGRGINSLYRGRCLLVRSRSRERILRALLASLSTHLDGADPEELLRIRQLVLVGGSSAILLPHELLARLETVEPELRERGLRLADPPFASLDPETGEVVLPTPSLDAPAAPIDAIARAEGRGGGERPPNGRYPVRGWAILHKDREATLDARAGFAAMLPIVESEGNLGMQRGMDALAKAMSDAVVEPIWYRESAELLKQLVRLAEDAAL